MADLKISQFTAWTTSPPSGLFAQLEIATNDVSNTTQGASGTDTKITGLQFLSEAEDVFFTEAANRVLLASGAGSVPTSSANLTFVSNVLTTPTLTATLAVIMNGSTSGAVTLQAGAVVIPYSLTMPLAAPTQNGDVMVFSTAGVGTFVHGSSFGSVTGIAPTTATAIVRWNDTAATIIENSGVLIDNSANITGALSLAVGGLSFATNTISATVLNSNLELAGNGTGYVHSADLIATDTGMFLKQTNAGPDGITYVAPSVVGTPYTVVSQSNAGTIGQVPTILSVASNIVTMGWTTVAATIVTTTPTTWTGIWASPQTADMETRTDGNTVTLVIPAIPAAIATIAATVTNTTPLPLSLHPANMQFFDIWVYDVGNPIKGLAVVGTGGTVSISLQKDGLNGIGGGYNFTGSGVSGWPEIIITYSLT